MGAATLGPFLALTWWLLPGPVTYSVADGFLTARRGNWLRKRLPLDRIAGLDFDAEVHWSDLIFSGWFTWDSAIPSLSVTMTSTANRWDPSNSAVEELPCILLSGEHQRRALRELREALGQLPTEPAPGPASHGSGR